MRPKPLSEADRVIGAGSGRAKYQRRAQQVKTVVHRGRRGRLLLLLEFLAKHSARALYLLLVGNCLGADVHLLAELFPHLSVRRRRSSSEALAMHAVCVCSVLPCCGLLHR